MCDGAGRLNQVNPVTGAGHTAWIVNDLTLTEFQTLGLDALMVNNCSNGLYAQEYLDHLADIETAVANGMVLIIHDRYVEAAETILPGGGSFDVRRDFVDDRQIDAADDTTLVTGGPAGTLTDTSLDNGCSSNHGFTVAGSVPADARVIPTRSSPGDLVTFTSRYGAGAVVYSTIPLDCYLDGSGCDIGPTVRDVYAVNLLHCTATLVESACGNGAIDAGEQCDDGANNNGVSCCTYDCRLRGAGHVCRASDGVCDGAEVCDGASGACPADGFVSPGTECRPAADDCDLAESCTGSDAACPADAVKPDTDADTVCDFLDNCDATPNAGQADADLDDVGDACDLCTAVSPAVQAKGTRIVVAKLNTPPETTVSRSPGASSERRCRRSPTSRPRAYASCSTS